MDALSLFCGFSMFFMLYMVFKNQNQLGNKEKHDVNINITIEPEEFEEISEEDLKKIESDDDPADFWKKS